MGADVRDLREFGREPGEFASDVAVAGAVAVAGGKAAALGELARIEGVRVPAGFCVTTAAFRRAVRDRPEIADRLDRLSRRGAADGESIGAEAAELRAAIEESPIDAELAGAVRRALAELGGPGSDGCAVAVRSSATTEDLPTASFAGQQDTYLKIVGPEAVLRHIGRCWASLFTDRAIAYRLHNGIDHRQAEMAVIVQEMVPARAAGVLFTADPVTSNRRVSCVEAVLGLGEGLLSGVAPADVYRVRDGAVIDRVVATRRSATGAGSPGEAALSDAQIVALEQLGRRIEAHFGAPQDVEWCLTDDGFWIVQSRPITTLFPLPPAGDARTHVYLSVGHQQMMTDPIKPLGLSFWLMTTPREMVVAGGRLFVDVAPILASPEGRESLLSAFGRSDPLTGDALRTVIDRDLVPLDSAAGDDDVVPPALRRASPDPRAGDAAPVADVEAGVVSELIEATRASIAALQVEIATRSGSELLDFIAEDLHELRRILFDPRSLQVIRASMDAMEWLGESLEEWLGESGAADALIQAAPGNVTSEMGLALLDVADAVRPHPEVVAVLERAGGDDSFLDSLTTVPGGTEARASILAFLDAYGMRCTGEIDITRPRWSERPSTLLPVLLSHVRTFAPGEAARRLERGRREASRRAAELLERLRSKPGGDGERRAALTQRMIEQVRAFAGYREYPKFGMVSRYFVYKQALLGEAQRLVESGVLADATEIFELSFDELRDVVRTGRADRALICEREQAFRSYASLRPPRVMTSDGEVINGAYRREDLPRGALVGLAVSAGTVEGRARVVRDIAEADLADGDILVTVFTDPSWTPAFVAARGLVTEVGGLMTHGAVIAREYGLPAVVGVDRATSLIRDGQRIRVDGTAGVVQFLP